MIKLFREWVSTATDNYDINYGEPKEEMSEIVSETLASLKDYLEDCLSRDIMPINYSDPVNSPTLITVHFTAHFEPSSIKEVGILYKKDAHLNENNYYLVFNHNCEFKKYTDKNNISRVYRKFQYNITKYEYDSIFNLIRYYIKKANEKHYHLTKDIVLDEIVPSRRNAKKFNI